MQPVPQPEPRELLPPILACLPTAFASERPPPALTPLLSPLLCQRIQYLSSETTSSGSWLNLLSWDASRSAKLAPIVDGMTLEPHPVSGEIELEDVDDIKYRRLDPETLHARLEVSEFGLLPIFLWVNTDQAGGGDGWRLAELRAIEDKEDESEWFPSITQANENIGARSAAHTNGLTLGNLGSSSTRDLQVEEEDDDYWDSYDRTPARTPAAKRSPAPRQTAHSNTNIQLPTATELEYFARYAAEVQPAMDPHDPDEEVPDAPPSTLNGNSNLQDAISSHVQPGYAPHQYEPPEASNIGPAGFGSSVPPSYEQLNEDPTQEPTPAPSLSHPRPESPRSTGSVDRLENGAAEQSRAEVAIKQHISTDLKSLYRLARATGMDRAEFERVVRTELDCLGMMEMDE